MPSKSKSKTVKTHHVNPKDPVRQFQRVLPSRWLMMILLASGADVVRWQGEIARDCVPGR
jgi:hypothetical protein